jgi:MFS family permease
VVIFFRLSAASVTTQFLGPLLSAYLMRRSPWLPMLLGLGVQILPIVLAFFIPETLNYNETAPEELIPSSSSSSCSSKEASIWKKSRDALKDSFSTLSSDSRMFYLMPAFCLHMLLINRDVLRQYISTRYHISISTATVLLSVRSGLIMLLCLFLLPAINHLFRKHWNIPPKRSDLLLSRFSCLAMALGFLLIALAPSIPLLVAAMVVNTFGWGLILFLRSLIISLVEPHHIARVNTFVGIFDTAGLMIGSPGLAWLFEKGVEIGGMWIGLPFLVCAGAVAIVAIVLSGISIGDEISEDRSGDGEGV